MSATQAERRSAIEHELFEITDEIKEAMKRAGIENRKNILTLIAQINLKREITSGHTIRTNHFL